jgi:hypothetical protein
MDKDLENLREYLKLYMGILLEMFTPPDQFDGKLERLRNQNKENRIAVDMIRKERARLQAMGQDSSLEAAITSLRGGNR